MPALFQCRLPLIHSVCVKVRRFPGKSMRPVGACVCALYRGSGYGNWERRREGDDAVHWRAPSISCAWMRLIGERERERAVHTFLCTAYGTAPLSLSASSISSLLTPKSIWK